jgi:hypothetical protein
MTTTPRFHAFAAARRCLSALAIAAAPALLATALPAGASAPSERVSCTTEPRSRWISEAEVKRLFGVDKYVLVKFKVSRANCYEFYAVGREGGVVEAYYHPITGRLMKENRVGTEPRPGQ